MSVTVTCVACGKEITEEKSFQIASTDKRVCRSHVEIRQRIPLRVLSDPNIKRDANWFKTFDQEVTEQVDEWAMLLFNTELDVETVHMCTMALAPWGLTDVEVEIQKEILEAALDVIDNPTFMEQNKIVT